MPRRSHRVQQIKAAANPEAAAFARQERVQRELAAKAERRAATETIRRWVFKLDPDRDGAGRRMNIPIRGRDDVIRANNGNQNIVFQDYVFQTADKVVRDFLREKIREKKLKGLTEVLNPVVGCMVPGCGFKGTWDEMKVHFQALHVGTGDEDAVDGDDDETSEGDAPPEE